jgi:hypothetical protein
VDASCCEVAVKLLEMASSQSPDGGLSSYRAIESAGPDEFAGSGFDDRFDAVPTVGCYDV